MAEKNYKVPVWYPNTLDYIKTIGKGSFGTVMLAQIPNNNEYKIAVKRNLISKNVSFFNSHKELDILARLKNHPFIVTLESITYDNPFKEHYVLEYIDTNKLRADRLYFIFENCAYDGATLIAGKPSYSYLKMAMCQLLMGIEHMHSRGIIHRDLKPGNLLWWRGKGVERQLKICDFGMSTYYCKQDKMETSVVTPWYRAPELLLGNEKYDYKSDMWSIGCILFEMIAGVPLLYNPDTRDDKLVILHKILTIMPEYPTKELLLSVSGKKELSLNVNFSYYSKSRPTYDALIKLSPSNIALFNNDRFGKYSQYLDLIHKCLKFSPYERYSATQALNHSFFDGFRNYINSARSAFPIKPSEEELLNPMKINYKSVQCSERMWAIYIFKNIHSKKDKFPGYRDRMIFMSMDLFDRYLVYLYENMTTKVNLINDINTIKGTFHTKLEAEARAISCFYISLKYYYEYSAGIHPFDSYVSPEFKTPEMLKEVENFELSMLTNILNYQIYRPTLYETLDLFTINGKSIELDNIDDLFNYYQTDEFLSKTNIFINNNPETLHSILKSYLSKYYQHNLFTNVINPQHSVNIPSIMVPNVNSYVPTTYYGNPKSYVMSTIRRPMNNIGMNTIGGMPTISNGFTHNNYNNINPAILIKP